MLRGLRRLWRRDDEALAWIERPATAARSDLYWLDPVVLDACFHVLASFEAVLESGQALLPAGVRRLVTRSKLPENLWCHVRWLKSVGPGRYEADMTLFDEGRCEVARLEGVQIADALREENAGLLAAVVAPSAGAAEGDDLAEQAAALTADIGTVEPQQARQRILEYLFDLLTRIAKWDDRQQAELKRALQRTRMNELGLDSLMAVQARARILADFHVEIPIHMFVSGSTLSDVAGPIYQHCMLRHLTTDRKAQGEDDAEEFVL
jgi:acyl carrier protein